MNAIGTSKLETNRLLLRQIASDDIDTLHREIISDSERLHFLDWDCETDVKSVTTFVEDIIKNYSKGDYFFWVIEEKVTKKFVGCIFVCHSDLRKRLAEIEYVISRKAEGFGYMTEAIRRIIIYLINEVGFYRIEGVCNVENTASARVMEKAGMTFEGIFRGRALNLNEEGNPGDLKIFSWIPSDGVRNQIKIRPLTLPECTYDLIKPFNRYQEVNQCWRKEQGDWVLKDVQQIEDWDEVQKAQKVDSMVWCIEHNGSVLGTFVEDKLVGFATLGPERCGAENEYIVLGMLHVSYEFRNRGMGKMLFAAVCEQAKQMDAQKLYISAHSSKASQGFYRAVNCVDAKTNNPAFADEEAYTCQMEFELGGF